MTRITEDEWQAELERLAAASRTTGGDGLTGPEWAQRLGLSRRQVRALLGAAKARGLLVVNKGKREVLDGRMVTMPVYAIRSSANGSGATPAADPSEAG